MSRITRLSLFFVVVLLLLCAMLSLVACGGGGGSSGAQTYYAYDNGVKQSDDWIKLDGNAWSDNDGLSGRLEYKNGAYYGYASVFGEEDVLFYGTVVDGAFEYSLDGNLWYTYYADNSGASNKSSAMHAKDNGGGSITPTPSKTQYTVTFESNGGTSVASKTVNEGEKLTAPTQPTKTMYIFNGWYKDSSCRNVWDFDTDTVTGNITLYAKWQADEVRITSVNGATIDGKTVTVVIDDTVDEIDLSDKVVLNSDSATWRLYFDRAGESEIRTKIAATRSGHFADADNKFYIVVTSSDGTQSQTYVLNIYKKYAVEVVIHDVDDEIIDSYTAYTTEVLQTPAETSFVGYTFNGWRAEDATFGEPIPMNVLDRVIHIYPSFTANTYTVTLDPGDGQVEKSQYTVSYDSDFSFNVASKVGHTFQAWAHGADVTDGSGEGIWKINSDVTLTARYTPNDYELDVITNDEDAGTAETTGSSTYGESFTLTATANKGYTFLGWYDGDTLVGTDLRTTLSVPAGNKTYTARFTYYTVSTSSTGGGTYTTYTEQKITAGDAVTLTANTYLGYTWLGWYDGDAKVSDGSNLSFTFDMPNGNKTFEAKWDVTEEMSHFDFTSSATTCTITGAKDKTVTEITIPNSVTSIGEYAFRDCTSLTNITIPDGVTSIGYGAFRGCSGLVSMTIPFVGGSRKTSSDTYQYPFGYIFGTSSYTGGTSKRQYYYGSSTSSTTNTTYYIPTSLCSVTVTGGNILYGAFYNCSMLTSITIPDGVTSIGGSAFFDCSALTSITIPDGVTSIGNSAFEYCTSLTSITIPDSVTSIGRWAFDFCPIETATIPAMACSYVKNSELQSVTITSGTSISSDAFNGYTSLTSVTIGNSVTSIGSKAFYNCTSLTSVTIGSGVKSIGSEAFRFCYKLVEVYNESSLNITKGSSDNGYVGRYAKAVYTEPYESKLSTDENGYILYTDGEEISLIGYTGTDTVLTLPAGITEINQYAFYNDAKITSITIPSGVTSIGERAFDDCTSLTSVYYTGDIASWCGITFNSNPLSRVHNLYVNNRIISGDIVLPDTITAIPSYTFENSTITSITIPDSVTSIGDYAFKYCTSLTSVTIGSGVTSIGNSAFEFCYKLVEVYNKSSLSITKGSTSNGYIGYYAKNVYTVEGGSKLSTDANGYILYTDGEEILLIGYIGTDTVLTLPAGITEINQFAFYENENITSITIPDGVTSIGSGAFSGCTSLTSVTIGNSVTSIGASAFSYCTALSSITYQGTKAQWNAISKGSSWNSSTGAYTIHCTDGDVAK